ncbi:N-acetylmuramoyl-L-alanine amidase [Bacillus sp. DTU_2020_1000418_1_SI_GHA_SEK_038]|uniref:N-acetylmuramoyl-L-alanine amidase n=1 Tax=Bacillus sp. DTU_2020_1000418_1_SI_GHA_SEK_038 TaxID=3077585 RepID=UPI0028F014B8|nr:N-acetylmuramoyl-L-alanine amidase [Bacillus sp. DTU_2020_1000418_1_SI_GHA_SEK_038]WNS74227.1 N-acetylmuramoyl-L-alanine amidase [Bacillus sp. DTU_2020_1000418_1_SI_GHA_SEK_038]
MTNWKQDAGHGGKDPGAVAKGNIEKVYTLEAALYVNKRLSDHGIESECTRYKDETLDEDQRVAKVKKFKKCMSHHFNASGGSGIEVIHSIHSDGKFEHFLIEEFRAAGYPVRSRPVFFKSLPNNPKQDFYYMHRRTGNCRTTIIEYDFVDGPQSEKIKDKAYREGMYECVVRAICRDEGVVYKPLNPKEVKSVSEQTLTPGQEAVRQEAIRLGITDGKKPFREVNQYYVWNAMIPLARRVEELEKKLK